MSPCQGWVSRTTPSAASAGQASARLLWLRTAAIASGPRNSTATHVPVTSVDAFCEERHVLPDWITLDIEGYEVAALSGARGTIDAGRGRVGLIVEMHPGLWPISGTSRRELENLLGDLRLVPLGLTGQQDPLGESGVVLLEYL